MILTKERQKQIDQKISELLFSVDMSYPENTLEDIVSAKGINVVIRDLKDFAGGKEEISGIIISQNGSVNILLNDENSPQRQTFSLAHELGHYILHGLEEGDGIKFRLDKYNYTANSKESQEETEANYFAASLLVPKDKLIRVIEKAETVDQVAAYFGVSKQMILNRWRWIRSN